MLPQDFEGWWNAPGEWVEEPNRRRSGWSGMMRCRVDGRVYYVKRQCNHLYRSLRHPGGRPTAQREHANLIRLKTLGIEVPKPVFFGSRRTSDGFEAVLVTEELIGYTPLDSQTGLSATERTELAVRVGETLRVMHRANLQHSCLYDKHIFICWWESGPQIALIDLEKLRRRLLPGRAAKHDLDQLRRHQTIWSEQEWHTLLRAHGGSTAR
jgi:serine/threonine-protein kinase RIO1